MHGRVEEGLAVAFASVGVAPDDVKVRGNYARLLLENNRVEEALHEFRIVHNSRPHNSDVVQVLGILSLQQGSLADAAVFFDKLEAFPGRRIEADYYHGRVAEERGDMQEALRIYRKIPAGEFFNNAQVSIAEVHRKLGEHEKAAMQLEKAARLGRGRERESRALPDSRQST